MRTGIKVLNRGAPKAKQEEAYRCAAQALARVGTVLEVALSAGVSASTINAIMAGRDVSSEMCDLVISWWTAKGEQYQAVTKAAKSTLGKKVRRAAAAAKRAAQAAAVEAKRVAKAADQAAKQQAFWAHRQAHLDNPVKFRRRLFCAHCGAAAHTGGC